MGLNRKRGTLEMPVWLIWALIVMVVALIVLGITSGKLEDMLHSIGSLLTPS